MPSRRPRLRLTGPSTRSAALRIRTVRPRPAPPRRRSLVAGHLSPPGAVLELAARVAAVLLDAHGQAVVSHGTAAVLWELAIPAQGSDTRVHLTVATGSAARNRADRYVHRLPLASDEITRIAGIAVTTRRAPGATWPWSCRAPSCWP